MEHLELVLVTATWIKRGVRGNLTVRLSCRFCSRRMGWERQTSSSYRTNPIVWPSECGAPDSGIGVANVARHMHSFAFEDVPPPGEVHVVTADAVWRRHLLLSLFTSRLCILSLSLIHSVSDAVPLSRPLCLHSLALLLGFYLYISDETSDYIFHSRTQRYEYANVMLCCCRCRSSTAGAVRLY